MSFNLNEFLEFLTQQRGIELPKDVAQANLPYFTKAALALDPNRFLFLHLAQPRPGEVGRQGREAVVFFTSNEPGSSNRKEPAKGNEPRLPKEPSLEARAIMTEHELTVAATEDQVHESLRSLVYDTAVLTLAEYCEELLVKGDGNERKGLLDVRSAEPIAKNKEESWEKFCHRALMERASKIRPSPTHIVLSNIDKHNWHAEEMKRAAQEFPKQPWGTPLITLDAVPKGRGLILSVNDIDLASSPLKWEFRCGKDEPRAGGQSEIIIRWEMGLIIRRPEAITQLILEDKKG